MINFVGPSYYLNTRRSDVQRTVNMYLSVNEVTGGKTQGRLDSIPGLTMFSPVPDIPPAVGGVGWLDPVQSGETPSSASTANTGVIEWGYYPKFYGGILDNDSGGVPPVEFEVDSWVPVVPGDPPPILYQGDEWVTPGIFYAEHQRVEVAPATEEAPAVYRLAPGLLKIRARIVGGGVFPGRLVLAAAYQPDSAEYWYGLFEWSWEAST